MELLNFVRANLEAGCVPLGAIRRPDVFNEVEYRFRRYHNSRTDCIKTVYHVSESEWALVNALILTRTRTRNGTARHKKSTGRPRG